MVDMCYLLFRCIVDLLFYSKNWPFMHGQVFYKKHTPRCSMNRMGVEMMKKCRLLLALFFSISCLLTACSDDEQIKSKFKQ